MSDNPVQSSPSRCIDIGDGGWLCLGPAMDEVRRDELGERWCFVCRARRPFVQVIEVPVGLSYYGPRIFIECDRQHFDGDVFPGRCREWEEIA